MDRRLFIVGTAGLAAVLPFAARAQGGKLKIATIGAGREGRGAQHPVFAKGKAIR